MPVLLIAEVPNLTEEVYAGMADQMMPLMRASKGFLCHAGGPNPAGGWRVVEVWESEEDGQNWFNDNINPTCHLASCLIRRITPFTPRSPSRAPSPGAPGRWKVLQGPALACRVPGRAWRAAARRGEIHGSVRFGRIVCHG